MVLYYHVHNILQCTEVMKRIFCKYISLYTLYRPLALKSMTTSDPEGYELHNFGKWIHSLYNNAYSFVLRNYGKWYKIFQVKDPSIHPILKKIFKWILSNFLWIQRVCKISCYFKNAKYYINQYDCLPFTWAHSL